MRFEMAFWQFLTLLFLVATALGLQALASFFRNLLQLSAGGPWF